MPVPQKIPIFTTIFNFILLAMLFVGLALRLCIRAVVGSKGSTRKRDNPSRKSEVSSNIATASEINDILAASGYRAREHVVTTRDGYLLVIHKIEKAHQEEPIRPRAVVYMHHGLLTNSELWVLGSSKEKSLPYLLVDAGYDVYLGNNRGNKYSRKHLKLPVSEPEFWDFSLDEFAYFDIPDTMDYIESLYKCKSRSVASGIGGMNSRSFLSIPESGTITPRSSTSTLSHYESPIDIIYIGFSQGCSQLLASLSIHPDLNTKIKLFIGLSPAIIPSNLNHPIFKLIVDQAAADNSFLYSIFGRRAIMPSVAFWSTMMGTRVYEKVVDKSLSLLFGWNGTNISQEQKRIGYPHMFSNSSVKSLLHWFQIIKAGRFQMFDETCSCGLTKLSALTSRSKAKGVRVTPFPITDHLNVPMYLFYGDSDILVDIEKTKSLIVDSNPMMKDKLKFELCKNYEHMDTLWGDDVYEDVFKKVLLELDSLDSAKIEI